MSNNLSCIDRCDLPLAIAYVPMQKWEDIYSEDKAYSVGTLFAELNKPYLGRNYDVK